MRAATLASLLLLAAACDGESIPDAGAPPSDAGDGYFDCDPQHVTCDTPVPMCMPQYAAQVEDACWTTCLQTVLCREIACTDATAMDACPEGWGCVLGRCRPPR
ncbi:MAG: hypothetical protein AB7S26_06980 [Sandaracinaceae bacterium]